MIGKRMTSRALCMCMMQWARRSPLGGGQAPCVRDVKKIVLRSKYREGPDGHTVTGFKLKNRPIVQFGLAACQWLGCAIG